MECICITYAISGRQSSALDWDTNGYLMNTDTTPSVLLEATGPSMN